MWEGLHNLNSYSQGFQTSIFPNPRFYYSNFEFLTRSTYDYQKSPQQLVGLWLESHHYCPVVQMLTISWTMDYENTLVMEVLRFVKYTTGLKTRIKYVGNRLVGSSQEQKEFNRIAPTLQHALKLFLIILEYLIACLVIFRSRSIHEPLCVCRIWNTTLGYYFMYQLNYTLKMMHWFQHVMQMCQIELTVLSPVW